jgi:hypothetical protein
MEMVTMILDYARALHPELIMHACAVLSCALLSLALLWRWRH